jgi:hypothetical protein
MEEDTEEITDRYVKYDTELIEISPVFHSFSSLDKVFRDEYLSQSCIKRREKTVKRFPLKLYTYESNQTKCRY